ncbi:MAG TPA: hypothetical protein EYH00_02225 [Archaeoglobus profundus]|nr:hypothetical protein [Archaeoglobus profundus]
MVVSKDGRSNLKPAPDVKMKHRKGEVVLCRNCKLSLDNCTVKHFNKPLPKDVSFPSIKV